MIVADTGAVLALIDSSDRHHRALRELYESDPDVWRLPWAILPEVDYLLSSQVGPGAEEDFVADVADGAFFIEWGNETDLKEARRICRRHRALKLGLVDSVVVAIAERLRAEAIATLDLRDFGSIRIKGDPKLFPRDL